MAYPHIIPSLNLCIRAAAPKVVKAIRDVQDDLASRTEIERLERHLRRLYCTLYEIESDSRRLWQQVPVQLSEVIQALGEFCRQQCEIICDWYRGVRENKGLRFFDWFAVKGKIDRTQKYSKRLTDCEDWYNIALKTFYLIASLQARPPSPLEYVTQQERLQASDEQHCRNELRKCLERTERARDRERSRYNRMMEAGVDLVALTEYAYDALNAPNTGPNSSTARHRSQARPRSHTRKHHRHSEPGLQPRKRTQPRSGLLNFFLGGSRVPSKSRTRREPQRESVSTRHRRKGPVDPQNFAYVATEPERRTAYQESAYQESTYQQPAYQQPDEPHQASQQSRIVDLNRPPSPPPQSEPPPSDHSHDERRTYRSSRRFRDSTSEASGSAQESLPPRRSNREERRYPPVSYETQHHHHRSTRSRSASSNRSSQYQPPTSRRADDTSSYMFQNSTEPGSSRPQRPHTHENIDPPIMYESQRRSTSTHSRPPPISDASSSRPESSRTRTSEDGSTPTSHYSRFVAESPRVRMAEVQASSARYVPKSINIRILDVNYQSRPPMTYSNPHERPERKKRSRSRSTHRSRDSGYATRSRGSSETDRSHGTGRSSGESSRWRRSSGHSTGPSSTSSRRQPADEPEDYFRERRDRRRRGRD
ncbi:uncharacterized protein LY89DRAFT_788610 [Mollisia scopiformis]|uniref:Uncharacterized protein n=1 Tax=Mollisia scopiformis TaxID=149040 RepID=A0A132B9Y3_MOLSC|nr:uncharacterized protein LY89DRAFT_788610 [Mollisia scopiformis]KUJ08674.1 hypothetical protein LY89DRAFT_788610 [Mollisia scopiformis]